MQFNLLSKSCIGDQVIWAAAILVLMLTCTLRAEEPLSRVLIENDGSTFYGLIEQTQFGFRITRNGHPEIVSQDRVRCVAATLEEAYGIMSQEMEQTALMNQLNTTADSHYQLAYWCYQYGLYQACKRELAEALTRDPTHARAAELAQKFVSRGEQPSNRTGSEFIQSLRTAKTQDEIKQKIFIQTTEAEVMALANAPRELAVEFQKLQPVIANHCGKGGCHDQTTNRDFVFLHLPRDGGLYRNRLEQNMTQLAEAMKRAGSIEAFSDLIRNKSQAHPANLFTGPHGKEHLKSITSWTESYGTVLGLPVRADRQEITTQQVPGEVVPASFERSESEKGTRDSEMRIEKTLDKARRDHAHDAFDPAVFNRRPR